MKKLLLLFVLVFLTACTQEIICNDPYIRVGTGCCADTNNNSICDIDEDLKEETEITVKGTAEKTVRVVRYVCPDKSIATHAEDCFKEPFEEEINLPTLATTNERNTVIKEVNLKPICHKGESGGQIFFEVGTVPDDIQFQIREPEGPWQPLLNRSGIYQTFTTFVICDTCLRGDIQLKQDKLYIFRIRFNQTSIYDRIEYSNEHLIDTRESSPYRSVVCSR